MPDKFPDLSNLLGAVIVSVISGTASITRRMGKGETFSFIMITSEFLTAILSGYLMYSAYPGLKASLPEWFTLPIAVAVTAHMGGRIFQEFEDVLVTRAKKIFNNN